MRTAQVIVKQGYKAQAHTCDVTDNTAVEVLAKNVGYVDILINSAGVIYFDPILKTQQAMVSKVLDINVASHFVMIRNFLPQMLERNKGHIVGIASCSGLLGVSNAVLYSCSKFAVVGLMNSLYEELRHQGRHNIKTSCVCQYFLRVIEGIDNKIETRIPPLDVEDGVRQIVQGILQERSMFTVPNHMLALINIGRSVPDSTRNKLRDAVYTRIKPDAN
ncbi:17-beta-hydroxysteroid dehydrogenase 13-like isoform X2 [Periplaneta americana]